MNKICVYTICKNEEKFALRWYESMKEADSVVVLDTGSTDDTVMILRSLGVKVEVNEISPWRFDVARNESLKLVPEDCNILVCTDLDEVFEPGWADKLRQAWKPDTQRAEYLYVWSHTESGREARVFRYNKIHNREWVWKYPVHELLVNINTNSEHYPADKAVQTYDIKLHHYPDLTKSRGSYLELLKLRKLESPEDWYGRLYYAHELNYRGFYKESIQELDEVLNNYSSYYSSNEKASCHLFKGDCFKQLGDLTSAREEYLKAIDVDKTYREGYLGVASIYMKSQDYQLAISYIKQGLAKSYRHYTWLERDASWTWQPYDMLSICCFYSGHKFDSITYAVKALSFDPEDERLKSNLKACLNNTPDSEYYN